jgi:23S rRNA pseudouridine2605 synthase
MRSERKSTKAVEEKTIRLNKYIADAGVCSRREADKLIADGKIKVNGVVETRMGLQVSKRDKIEYMGKTLSSETLIYLLLNKPKGFITTVKDEKGRKTVMDIIKGACDERIYPVGRLDRNTTGVLLFTNDGELAKTLTHPKHQIEKIYKVSLGKNMSEKDFESLQKGFELEDGFIKPDEVAIIDGDSKSIGLRIHSGRNRIVRRMFEHLGYEVLRLDRTLFGGLSKKSLARGKWRFLNEKEVRELKRRS